MTQRRPAHLCLTGTSSRVTKMECTTMKAIIRCLPVFASIALGACSQPVDAASSSDGSEVTQDELSRDAAGLTLRCTSDGIGTKVVIAARNFTFDVTATANGNALFQASAQRPSLNARIEDGASTTVNEYVDFHDSGLETVAVDSPNAIEIDLGGAKTFVYKDAAKTVQLTCSFDKERVLRFLKISPVPSVDMTGVKAVAFDIDDTLAFTTPTFARGFATGGQPKPEDILFWTHTNGCDAGCPSETLTLPDGTTKVLPATAASTPKAKALELIAFHKSQGHRVYAITARPDINGDPLRDYLEQALGIDRNDVFFEPDIDQPGNPKGKTDRIESLDLDIFYGDSDSDITDTAKAFADGSGAPRKVVRPIRFLRSPKSSNRKAGKLNKYHPGYYGEPVLEGSYD
jgi:acid phosphatase class B